MPERPVGRPFRGPAGERPDIEVPGGKQSIREVALSLTKDQKAEVLKAHRVHDTDTGSSEVQVALLTDRIRKLTSHFGTHGRDHNSKRGLLKMVGRRRRLLRYLERTQIGRYRTLVEKLGIRG